MEFFACSMLNTVNTAEQPVAKMGLRSNKSWVSLIKHRLNFKEKFGLFCKTAQMKDSGKNVIENCYYDFQFKSNHHIVSWSKAEHMYMYIYKVLKLYQANVACKGLMQHYIVKAHLFSTTQFHGTQSSA